MLKTTTSVVDGKQIVKYLDIVVGEVILRANIIKDVAINGEFLCSEFNDVYESSALSKS